MNNKLLIEVSHEDHAFVESVCVNGGFNFESFFKHLLNLYRKSLNETEDPINESKSRFKKQKSKV